MALWGKKKKKYVNDDVIVDEVRVSVSDLKHRAAVANRRFWSLLVSLVLVSVMILPYMSMAAVADESSDVFKGTVVPGYSMGGIELTAYGIDLNYWGKISTDKAVRTNYGVWSGTRGEQAQELLSNDSSFVALDEQQSANYNLSVRDKILGWTAITGKTSYTRSNPDGVTSTQGGDNQNLLVSPYRTVNDYNYWDSQTPKSGNNADANITVSLYPDFVVLALNENGTVVVPESVDDYRTQTKKDKLCAVEEPTGDTTHPDGIEQCPAVPYYIPLSALFDLYDYEEPAASTINNLIESIKREPDRLSADFMAKNDLLQETKYEALNSDIASNGTSEESFNPYPYSMVFSSSTTDGQQVVSSIYENSEAYVYFSPSSAYTAYMHLKSEYETKKSTEAVNVANGNTVTAFELGYYLAGMSILEAYLDEALPQDMTRGYVGPSEPRNVAMAASEENLNLGNGSVYKTTNSENSSVLASGQTNVSTEAKAVQTTPYLTLMYDYVRTLMPAGGGAEYNLGSTNAILDTLSVYGYNAPADDEHNPGPGVMKGLCARLAQTRSTLFTPYEADARATSESHDGENSGDDDSVTSVGLYTPVYYPIQQHKMPAVEKPYRFQILAAVPYATVLSYIKEFGFAGTVQFTYSKEETDDRANPANLLANEETREAVAALVNMYNKEENEATGQYVNQADTTKMSSLNSAGDGGDVLGLDTSGTEGEDKSYGEGEQTAERVTKRTDNALLAYPNNTMTADNVHDLFDVVRSIKNMKYETWFRYYNPVKSEGGDNDFFISRISPALNTYMPSILINGYTCSGSGYINDTLTTTNCSFDYYSTPSFAPCFAAHTMDNCYYGILNFEQRAFFSKKFLSSLPQKGMGLPALEAAELAEDAMEKLQDENNLDTETANKNVATLWVMGKRLALILTLQDLHQATVSGQFLQDKMTLAPTSPSYVAQIEDPSKKDTKAVKPTDIGSMTFKPTSTTPDSENKEVPIGYWSAVPKYAGVSFDDSQWVWEKNQKWIKTHFMPVKDNDGNIIKDSKGEQVVKPAFAVIPDGEGGPLTRAPLLNQLVGADAKALGTGGRDAPKLDGSDNKSEYIVYLTNGQSGKDEVVLVVSSHLFITAAYDRYLQQFFGSEDATYYWTSIDNMEEITKNTEPVIDDSKGGAYDEGEAFRYTVMFNSGVDIFDGKKIGDSSIQQAYEQAMAEAAAQLQTYVQNMTQDMKTIADSMPHQMQNCLAWADYQNSSDSEYQYQVDPSDTNVVVNVSTNVSQTATDSNQKILSLKALHKAGYTWDKDSGVYMRSNAASANGVDSSKESRMVRGVEGSTWTSTQLPAEYTMTATIGRVTEMAQDTGTNYPYAGIANGYLMSGTDRYALMQAHVIDYASIASGIAGDLALRQQTRVVKITNPEYSGLPNLFTLLGSIGALFAEFGKSALTMTSNLFSSQFWLPSNNNQSSANQVVGAAPAGVYYSGYNNGIVMNRVPASVAKFDISSGKLVRANESSYASASGSAGWSTSNSIASAAGLTRIENAVAPMLLRQFSGVYQMMQSIGLILVMVCLTVIAFKNFIAYSTANSGTNHGQMIEAERQLKVVLPRAIFAIFMIGLPPIGSSIGFEGGGYILLQLLGNVITYVANIFMSLNGSGIMGLWTSMDISQFGNDIGAYFFFFLFAIVLSILFLLGTVCIIVQGLLLLGYYVVGPIIWAFYVWPKDAPGAGITTMLPLSFFTWKNDDGSHARGSDAPRAWIRGYVAVSALTAIWAIMFWVLSMFFVGTMNITPGSGALGFGEAGAAERVIGSTGYPQASAALFSDAFLNTIHAPHWLTNLFNLVLAIILFLLMFRNMTSVCKMAIDSGKQTALAIGNTVSEASKIPFGLGKDKKESSSSSSKGSSSTVPIHKRVGKGGASGVPGGIDPRRAKEIISRSASGATTVSPKDGEGLARTKGKGAATKGTTPLIPAGAAAAAQKAMSSPAGTAGLGEGAAPLAAGMPAVVAMPAVAAPAKSSKPKKKSLLRDIGSGTMAGLGDSIDAKALDKEKRRLNAANELAAALNGMKATDDKDKRLSLMNGLSADARNLMKHDKIGALKNGDIAEGQALDKAIANTKKYQNSLEKKVNSIEGRQEKRDMKEFSARAQKVRGLVGDKTKPDLAALNEEEDYRQKALDANYKSSKTARALGEAEDYKAAFSGTDYTERSAKEAMNDLTEASANLSNMLGHAFDHEDMTDAEKLAHIKDFLEKTRAPLISADKANELREAIKDGNAGALTTAERNSLIAYETMEKLNKQLAPAAAMEALSEAQLKQDPNLTAAYEIKQERDKLLEGVNESRSLMPAVIDGVKANSAVDPNSLSDGLEQFFENAKNCDNVRDFFDLSNKAIANPSMFGLEEKDAKKLAGSLEKFENGDWMYDKNNKVLSEFRTAVCNELDAKIDTEKALTSPEVVDELTANIGDSIAAAALSGDAIKEGQAGIALARGLNEYNDAIYDAFADVDNLANFDDARQQALTKIASERNQAHGLLEESKNRLDESLALFDARERAEANLHNVAMQYGIDSHEYQEAGAALAAADHEYESGLDLSSAQAAYDKALAADRQLHSDYLQANTFLNSATGQAIFDEMRGVVSGVDVDQNFVPERMFGKGAENLADMSFLADEQPALAGGESTMMPLEAAQTAGVSPVAMSPDAFNNANAGGAFFAETPPVAVAPVVIAGGSPVFGTEADEAMGVVNPIGAGAGSLVGPSQEAIEQAQAIQDEALLAGARAEAEAVQYAGESRADNLYDRVAVKQDLHEREMNTLYDIAEEERLNAWDVADAKKAVSDDKMKLIYDTAARERGNILDVASAQEAVANEKMNLIYDTAAQDRGNIMDVADARRVAADERINTIRDVADQDRGNILEVANAQRVAADDKVNMIYEMAEQERIRAYDAVDNGDSFFGGMAYDSGYAGHRPLNSMSSSGSDNNNIPLDAVANQKKPVSQDARIDDEKMKNSNSQVGKAGGSLSSDNQRKPRRRHQAGDES